MNTTLKNSIWGMFIIPILGLLLFHLNNSSLFGIAIAFVVLTIITQALGLRTISWTISIAMAGIIFSKEVVTKKVALLEGADRLFSYLIGCPIGYLTTVTMVVVVVITIMGFTISVQNVATHFRGRKDFVNGGFACSIGAACSVVVVSLAIFFARKDITTTYLPGFESIEQIRSIGDQVAEFKTKKADSIKGSDKSSTVEVKKGTPYRDPWMLYWSPINPYQISDIPTEVIKQLQRFENAPLALGKKQSGRRYDTHGNVWEVGFGITDHEIRSAKRIGLIPEHAQLPPRLSKQQAERWFMEVTLPTYAHLVNRQVNIALSKEQWWALISFTHNLGPGNLQRLLSTHDRHLLSNMPAIGRAIALYNKAGGQKLRGLEVRRQAESMCFLKKDFNAYVVDRKRKKS